MKRNNIAFILGIFSVVVLLLVGCKKDEPETFAANLSRPSWTAVEGGDITLSMTAVVKVDLKAQYPEKAADFVLDDKDLLAAFSGETCLGTASPQDGLFFLYVSSPSSASDSTQKACRRVDDTPSPQKHIEVLMIAVLCRKPAEGLMTAVLVSPVRYR
jgi:hypothetical protein